MYDAMVREIRILFFYRNGAVAQGKIGHMVIGGPTK